MVSFHSDGTQIFYVALPHLLIPLILDVAHHGSSHLLRPKSGVGVGLLSRIFSISSMTSGVSFGTSSSALQFSAIWEGLEAPRMTVLTFSFLMHQAMLSEAVVPPRRLATSVSLRTLAIFCLPSSSCSDLTVFWKKSLLVAKRESSGMPSLYLPVSRPEASGDQMVVPYLNCSKMGSYSTSKRWRWKAVAARLAYVTWFRCLRGTATYHCIAAARQPER